MQESETLVLVMTTVQSAGDADVLAKWLVDQSLAACIQIDGPVTSHYRWVGNVEQSTEYRLQIKTTLGRWATLKERLPKVHPYEEPEIIMMEISAASDGYRDWVIDQTT